MLLTNIESFYLNFSLQRFDPELVSGYEISHLEGPPVFKMFDITLERNPQAEMFKNTFKLRGKKAYNGVKKLRAFSNFELTSPQLEYCI